MSDQQQDQQQQQQNQSEQSQPESSGVDASGGSDGGAGHEKAEVAAEQQQQHGHNPEQGDEDKAHAASSGDGSEGTSESKNDFVKVEAKDIQECSSEFAGADSKQELEQEHQQKEANEDGDCSVDVEQTSELIERSGDNTNTSDTNAEKQPIDKKSSIGHSMLPITETQEVSSTKNDDPPRSMRTSRRSSYQSSRGYAGGYQNYGLAYLPYKSNFEPSEDARRKADEFFKTLKL